MMATVTPRPSAIAPPELDRFVVAGVISASDVAATAGLVRIARGDGTDPDPDLRAWLALCLAVRASHDGHTCFPLAEPPAWLADIELGQGPPLDWPADVEAWQAVFRTAGPLVGGPNDRAPFVVEHDRLYLARSRHEEREIARRLTAMGDRLEILLGGPGTGKTTQVASRLVASFQKNPGTRIALAAPTGKAAARMKEALLGRLTDEKAPAEVKTATHHHPQTPRHAAEKRAPLSVQRREPAHLRARRHRRGLDDLEFAHASPSRGARRHDTAPARRRS
jgi:exodeoxyribonuclease V alpha subunit